MSWSGSADTGTAATSIWESLRRRAMIPFLCPRVVEWIVYHDSAKAIAHLNGSGSTPATYR